jgi:hypothetical protein
MRKIPTVFVRNPDDRRYVLPEVTPGCEWVLAGEGTATAKYDGTCTAFDGEQWWARREVKPGKTPPPNWEEIDADEVTGKRVGWEPIEQSPFAKAFSDALDNVRPTTIGTYELIGPKVNGNPHERTTHLLVRHGAVEVDLPASLTFDSLRDALAPYRGNDYRDWIEGIVWHHPDGRRAKLKARDFA